MDRPVVESREFFYVVANESGMTRAGMDDAFGSNCSVPGHSRPFVGYAEIEYGPKGWLIEFDSFREWLSSVGAVEGLSLEQLTRRIFDALRDALLPAHLRVRCKASPVAHPNAWAEITWSEE